MPGNRPIGEAWRSGWRRLLTGAVLLVALIVLALNLAKPRDRSTHDSLKGAAMESVLIEPRPFTASVSVVGAIIPTDEVDVTAPFAGAPKQIEFTYGDPVNEGQVLVEMDTSAIDRQRSEAEVLFLKAAQTVNDLKTWSSNPEVSRARRAETSAEFDLKNTENKIQEAASLLDRGLIARNEYDNLVQQRHVQQMNLTAASQDLAETLQRGEGANRRVALAEYDDAETRLRALDIQRSKATVRAPISGVFIRPPVDRSAQAPDLTSAFP